MIRQRSSSARQTVLLLLCLAGATACPAQSTAGDTVYHLHGTVIDGVTGKPLPRALVKSGDQRLATMTGTDGKFSIDISVPERPAGHGNFSSSLFLTAQKPGYLMQQNRMALFPLNDTLSSTPVELKLMPAAAVIGHVSSAATDFAAGVRVNLLLHQVQDGQFLWSPAGTTTTNAHGDFRFPGLRPGEYALVTSQWAGDQPQPAQRGTITQQYPPTFYGDVRNLAGAPRLHLHYGDTTPTEIHLHLATYYPVTIPITSGPPNQSVNARLVGVENLGNSPFRYNRAENAVEGSLPSGDYTLQLSAMAPGQPQSSAQVTLHVDSSPIRTAAIALAPAASIQVRVHPEFTNQEDLTKQQPPSVMLGNGSTFRARQPQLVQILLRSEDNGGNFIGASQPSANGDLVIENVQPGRYFVHQQPFHGYVASITSGGVDLLAHPLIVNPSGAPDPIDITLRDDFATLTGTVNPGDGPLPRMSVVVLLPTGSIGRFTQSYAGLDGKFTATNVPPGSYRVLAFPGQPLQLPYRDAEALHRYDNKGPSVTVAAGQSQQVDVPLLDEAEED